MEEEDLYIKNTYECLQINESGDEVEFLRVSIRGKANKVDVVKAYYKTPNQNEEVDKIFYKQMGEVSQSLPLVLLRDFSFPDVCYTDRKSIGCYSP